MKIRSLVLGAGLAFAAASVTPSVASAAFDGWTVRGTSQRAGPGPEYPRIGYIPGGVHVRIFGCLRHIEYCDVAWRDDRGWVRGSALAGFYNGRRVPLVSFYVQLGVPFIGFNFGYWNDHYRDRPFFHERNKWWKDHHDGDNWDKKSGDWKKQSDEPQPTQFPRKKWEKGNDSMSEQSPEMQGPDGGKPGEKGKGECGPQSSNPKCAQMNQ